MYIVTNRVPVASPWREQFEERFRTRAGQIDQQPGFVRLQVLRPADAESPYVVLTAWRDRGAHGARGVGSGANATRLISLPRQGQRWEQVRRRHWRLRLGPWRHLSAEPPSTAE